MPARPTSEKTDYLALYRELEQNLGPEATSIAQLRKDAIAQFSAEGLPTRRLEEWRQTPIEQIARRHFAVDGADAGTAGALPTELVVPLLAAREPLLVDDAHLITFVNGRPVPGLSRVAGLPPGVTIGALSSLAPDVREEVTKLIGGQAHFEGRPFVALNTALMTDAAVVHLARGTSAENPIHILHLAAATETALQVSPRTLILAAEGCRATIVETYAGLAAAPYFSNAVTEVSVGPGAVVDHYKLQQESLGAYHIGAMDVELGRESVFSSHSIATGGRLARSEVNASLVGEGIDCTLNGLYLTTGDQHVDNHMLVRHMMPACTSHEQYQGILDGRSTAVFTGRIYVHPGAQKTDAKQSNRNLLLSREATANSNPQLEIFADDVRCTHGSTVGQLDLDALFFLRSRGIAEDAARSILVYAFAAEVLGQVKLSVVKERTEQMLAARLPRGDIIRGLV